MEPETVGAWVTIGVTAITTVAGSAWAGYRTLRSHLDNRANDRDELLKNYEGRLTELHNRVIAMQKGFDGECEGFRQEIAKLRENVEERDERIEALEDEVERLRTSVQERDRYINRLEGHINELAELMTAQGIAVPPMPERPGRRPRRKKAEVVGG